MPELIKILLIDDDEEDYIITREVIEEIPRRHYQLDWCSSYCEALPLIDQAGHDIYLVDYRLGVESGLDLIREAVQRGCCVPLILLTGQDDIEIDEKALRAGASDYLVKGKMNAQQLERSIRYSIGHARNLKQIQQLNIDLEKRVTERTEELGEAVRQLENTNKNLQNAQKEIRKALEKEIELNELKSRFVTIASHEFRTPLSTILSSVSLIAKYNEAGDVDKRLRHVERIKSSVRNLTGILNDFLSLSRLEEGKINNQPAWFDVTVLAEEVIGEMRAVARDNQPLVYAHTGEDKKVLLDRQSLKNVMINLMSNAIKYSPSVHPVDLLTEIKDGQLRITVRDRGIGIPKEEQVHVFSRFFRAHNVNNIQGTGLGLNIVRKYLEIMKGDIHFESEINQGTTFVVTFPATD